MKYLTTEHIRQHLRFGTADSYVSGTVICTRCDIDANIQNIANGSFEFKGTGELS